MTNHDNYQDKYLKYKIKYKNIQIKHSGGTPYMQSLKEISFTKSLESVGINDQDEFYRGLYNFDLFISRLYKLSITSGRHIDNLITNTDLLEYLNVKSPLSPELNIFLSDNLKDLNLLVEFDLFGFSLMKKLNLLVWCKEVSLVEQIEILKSIISTGIQPERVLKMFNRHIKLYYD